MKNPWVIIGLITVVLFGGAIWYGNYSDQKNNEGVEIVDHITGNKDATVSLVEYSDFQCPACGAFYPAVKDLLDQYGENIKFEYKHFPLVALHPYAIQAAVAAEAAGQQNKFYEFSDLLFVNQANWTASKTPTVLFLQYAEELGLDIPTFKRHMNSSLLKKRVQDQFAEGRDLGVSATPSFYLNGEFLNPDDFKTYQGFIDRVLEAIDPSLVKASSTPTSSEVKFGI